MWNYFWIGVGSAIGGMMRYGCSGWVAVRMGPSFPWGTLVVNTTGSFLIGFIGALTLPQGRMWMSPMARDFLMLGICGGYTTFSSFSLQTLNLLRDGDWLRAFLNIAGSVLGCMAAVWLGHVCAMSLNQMKGQ
jgi:CrcB protein